MKRFCVILLTFSSVCLSINDAYGESVDEVLGKVKEELGLELFTYETVYGPINAELATEGVSVDGSPKKQIFVYGNSSEASKELGMSTKDNNGNYRALGYSITGYPFPNPFFHDDYPSGSSNSVTRWYSIEELQSDSKVVNVKHATINAWLGSDVSRRSNWLRELVKEEAYDPDNFLKLHPELMHRSRLDPGDKNYIHLSEHAYILQPPTENSWGMASSFM